MWIYSLNKYQHIYLNNFCFCVSKESQIGDLDNCTSCLLGNLSIDLFSRILVGFVRA